ncbi:MAG: peroxiredoxin [Beijerinckiaceae bacterium]
MELAPGDMAPPFSLPTAGAGTATLEAHRGRKLALFFYPRDDTETCTAEAVGFQRHSSAIEAAGASLLGVSGDSVRSHEKFRSKYGLDYPLASDESGNTLRAYGVWVEKSMWGKTFFGIERSTFLIGPDGRILRVWRKVKVAGHAEEVLDAARAGWTTL